MIFSERNWSATATVALIWEVHLPEAKPFKFAMAKAAKSTRKFAASGQLKKVIQNRKKHQQIVKRAAGRRGAGKDAKGKGGRRVARDEEEVNEEVSMVSDKKGKR